MSLNEPLPEWASGLSNGAFKTLSQLCTRDGRRTGNAVIFKFEPSKFTDEDIAVVVTDAGNIMKLNENELGWLFYEPKYCMKDLLPAHIQALQVKGYKS